MQISMWHISHGIYMTSRGFSTCEYIPNINGVPARAHQEVEFQPQNPAEDTEHLATSADTVETGQSSAAHLLHQSLRCGMHERLDCPWPQNTKIMWSFLQKWCGWTPDIPSQRPYTLWNKWMESTYMRIDLDSIDVSKKHKKISIWIEVGKQATIKYRYITCTGSQGQAGRTDGIFI